MNEVFIVDGLRSPIGKYRGIYSTKRIDDLAALNIQKLLEKFPQIPPENFDEVVLGCANQAGEDNRNVARMAALLAGVPYQVPAYTVNRLCASGLSSIINAARSIQVGDQELVLAGGVENMTRAPLVMNKTEKSFSGDVKVYDTSLGWRFTNERLNDLYGSDPMGLTAENLVKKYKLSREDQDQFALKSHLKAVLATKNGRLKKEIFGYKKEAHSDSNIVYTDETIRFDTNLEKLSQLKAVFKKEGSVTAGNSSSLSDGTCVLLLASEKALKRYKLSPLAKIVANAEVGVLPQLMGIGPVDAIKSILKKTKKSLDQIDIIEINEAFSAQVLSCLQSLNIDYEDARVNPNGGAIALGHPLGMSGARLALTASYELKEQNKKLALCTLCVGVGQGVGVLLERV